MDTVTDRDGQERTETDRNGPKWTFVDTETDFLGTETDFSGYRNGLFGHKIVIRVLKMTEIQNIDTNLYQNFNISIGKLRKYKIIMKMFLNLLFKFTLNDQRN